MLPTPRVWGPRRAGCSSTPGLRSRPDPSQGPTGRPPSASSWGLHRDEGSRGRSLRWRQQAEQRRVQEGGSSQDVPGIRGSRGRQCPAWSLCWVRFQLSAGGCSLSRRYRRAWTPPQGCWGVGRVSGLTGRAGRQALASVPGPGHPGPAQTEGLHRPKQAPHARLPDLPPAPQSEYKSGPSASGLALLPPPLSLAFSPLFQVCLLAFCFSSERKLL